LSYLRRYPFDTLKIDRSFVSDITIDPQDRELVNAVIAMAHSLGLTVVAEGVESEAELNYLNMRGCDLVQGYLFSRPLSEPDLVEWAKKHEHSGPSTTYQAG
jgi:EAL domain-containing protein (putative c-di-GMP-specific phosphodiesterase class I)